MIAAAVRSCITRNAPRLDELAQQLPEDELVFTSDLGLELIVFNGPVKREDRVLLNYTAMAGYCSMCAGTDRDDKRKVTKDALLTSFDDPWYEPGDGSALPNRMLRAMTPRNTVPCMMHGQNRGCPQVVAMIWYRLAGGPQMAIAPCAVPWCM